MKYLSVCSGIEAATCGWHSLGWQPEAFSEIEKFPSKVLAHHYPNVPNLGDMTKFEEWNLEPIDLLVGGTPCQSFSVAGLRKGLSDPRGNLMLTFGAIANRFRPRWLVWENVPGVLSSNGGRDFGTFLGMLVELGYGWAYRVLDAQYFGVAQRRRRVFVVGHLGDFKRAAAVLFERHSLSGNPAPSREKKERVAKCAKTSARGRSHWDGDYPHPTLNHSSGLGYSNQELFTQRGAYLTSSSIGDLHSYSMITANTGANGLGVSREIAPTLDRAQPAAVAHPIPFRMDGDVMHEMIGTMTTREGNITDTAHAIAQPINIYGGNKRTDRPEGGFYVRMNEETSKTLDSTSGLNPSCSQGGTAVMQTITQYGKVAGSLTARYDSSPCADRGSNVVMQPISFAQSMQVRRLTPVECERLQGFLDNYTNIPGASDGPRYKALGNSMAVPVMSWIGKRIQQVEDIVDQSKTA